MQELQNSGLTEKAALVTRSSSLRERGPSPVRGPRDRPGELLKASRITIIDSKDGDDIVGAAPRSRQIRSPGRRPVEPETTHLFAYIIAWLPRWCLGQRALIVVGKIVFPMASEPRDRLSFVDSHQLAAHPHLVETLAVPAGIAVCGALKGAVLQRDREINAGVEGLLSERVSFSGSPFTLAGPDGRKEVVESHPSRNPTFG